MIHRTGQGELNLWLTFARYTGVSNINPASTTMKALDQRVKRENLSQ